MTSTLRGHSPHAPINSDTIYDRLTVRDKRSKLDQEYQNSGLQSKEKEYQGIIQNLIKQLQSKFGTYATDSWFYVNVDSNANYKSNYEKAPVEALKTYRTFVPSKDNLITNFLYSLPGFALELQQKINSDPDYPDRVQFKVPSRLKTLYYHPDSLVVHWRNIHNRNKINQTIDDYFFAKGVKFASRGPRAVQGYDMAANYKQGSSGASHSELISFALEKLIKENPQIYQHDEKFIKQWLMQWMNYFNKISPEKMHQYLTNGILS